MYYDKLKYEKLISESVLFSLDKNSEPTAYKRESYRMIENLYCYLMAVNRRDYESYACEIMEVSTRCICNYEPDKGVFLHYFNAAWKQEYSHLKGNQIVEDKLRGIKITEEDKRSVRKYVKLVESRDTGCTKDELYHRIAVAMELPVEKVRLIAELSDLRVSGETIQNDDGENASLWDKITDGMSIEDELSSASAVEDLLDKIEATFNMLQDRQKPVISDMMTSRIWSFISNEHGKTYSFISKEIYDICQKAGQAPSQRKIADKYGRDEASISRTFKEFIRKLKD